LAPSPRVSADNPDAAREPNPEVQRTTDAGIGVLDVTPEQIQAKLNALAHSEGRPANEILVLYLLESFLRRLQQTRFRDDFILKGGVLLAAHMLRRATRDIDMQAVDFTLDESHIQEMTQAVAEVDADDGVVFSTRPTSIEQIRDDDEYSGLRVKLPAQLGSFRASVTLDISTGDPIWPAAEKIHVPQLLGGDFEMQGHPLPTVIAEKSVTMLQRGSTSTRWRDVMDIRTLSSTYEFDLGTVREACRLVAESRQIELSSPREATDGWPAVAQAKWAAWRSRQGFDELTLADFNEQLEEVLQFIEPIFTNQADSSLHWDHATRTWI
jgi:hypothetical protein